MLNQITHRNVVPEQVMLERMLSQFSSLSTAALERIASGGASGFVTPTLARTILDARELLGQVG